MRNCLIFLFFFIAALCGCSDFPKQISQSLCAEFDLGDGVYGHGISVKLSTSQPGGTIFYSLGENSEIDTPYSGPIVLSSCGNYVIRARVCADDFEPSAVSVGRYRIVRSGTEDTIGWNKTFSEGDALFVTADDFGRVIVAGYAYGIVSKDSGRDGFIRRFSCDGNTDSGYLTSSISNGWRDDVIKAVACRGGIIYAVVNSSDDSSDPPSRSIWLKAFSSDGTENALWSRKIADNAADKYANDIKVDGDANIYVAGASENIVSAESGTDWWIRKFSFDGAEYVESWNKKMDASGGEDYVNKMALDGHGNIYVAGCVQNGLSKSSGYDWCVKKFSADGVEDVHNWNLVLDGNGGNDYLNAIAVSASGNVYAVGSGENIVGPSSMSDWWIRKFSSDGTEDAEWSFKYDGHMGNDYLNAAVIDSSGCLYVAGAGYRLLNGSSGYDWWIEKINPAGGVESIYMNSVEGLSVEDYANSLAVDFNNNVFVCGFKRSLQYPSERESWWIKKFFN